MRLVTRHSWLAAVMVVLLLGGIQQATPAAAQPATPRLSAPAQALTRYALTAADLPTGAQLAGPTRERTNEDVIISDPDAAASVRANGRLVGITQSVARSGQPSISAAVVLFKDAEGAWNDARDTSGLEGLDFQILPTPDVGERAIAVRIVIGAGTAATEIFALEFQRNRVESGVNITGPRGRVALDDLLPLATAIDKKILASPPGPVTPEELALIEEPTPAVLVRGAARVMMLRFIDELSAAQVLTEAWTAALAALRQAGATNLPPLPTFPQDDDAAIALHMQRFPMLETAAAATGRLTPRQLAYAAINGMVEGRDDCHTYLLSPEQWERQKASSTGGLQPPAFGISFALDTPVRLVAVQPGSPAKAAGLRRGQEILAINGTPTERLSVTDARALLRTTEGTPNTFTVRNPSGKVETITVAPARYSTPIMESEIIDNIGVIRFYGFNNGNEQITRMRAILFEFESRGVEGWLIDLRNNPGGASNTRRALTSLFVEGGRIDGLIMRGQPPVYSDAVGNTLPFQRPLAFLVGPGSASAGEIMPAALQLRGRAIVVGEQSAGCIGTTSANGLADGSALYVTRGEYVLGPNDARLHRVGVTPNVAAAAPTPLEEEEGRDPQIIAAIAALRQIITTGATFPIPPPPPRTAVILDF